jgi:hypothetical protein
MERPSELLKPFANHIARTALSEGSAQIVHLLRLSGFLGDPSDRLADGDETSGPFKAAPNPDHVGIWERRIENGKTCFVRRKEKIDEWHYWANLGRIEPKGAKRRVVWIGESVARGHLYDPLFTPALALETILQGQFGKDEIEVIDLARTNLCSEVRELAIEALQLEPDLVIIFSGNNWTVFTPPQPSEIAQIAAVMSKEGIGGAKRLAEDQLARNARRIVKDVASAYESRGVPLVWIIPEFNLDDWRGPITNAPHLADGLNREWMNLLEEAQSALRDGDLGRASELAKRVVEIDQGVCAAGLYILAECSQRSNDLDAARKYLELARDAAIWDSSVIVMPRSYSATQEALRDEVSEHNHQIVDLPRLFKEHLKGGIPGRRMFLDYCHMTTEGIQVAVAAAASCVLRALKGVEIPWRALVDERIAPTRETEAEASFLAAVHTAHYNAHRGRLSDLVGYYCLRALKLSPRLADLMINYIDLQTRSATPMLMCESAEQISRLGSPLMQHYLLRYNDQRLDRVLLDAIVDALKAVGIDAQERLDQLRREEHSVTRGEVNLLEYYYCSSVNQPQDVAWVMRMYGKKRLYSGAVYYKAYWFESRFIFVGEAGCPVNLRLTCRLPELAPPGAKISVELNGKPQVEFAGGRDWETWEIGIAGEAVRDGLNDVVICWPVPEFEGKKAFEKVIPVLFEGKIPVFYSVFGEIHSCTVSDGRNISTSLPYIAA